MNDHLPTNDGMEVERYELTEGPAYRFELDRREFIKLMAAGVAVAVVAGPAADSVNAQESDSSAADTEQIAAWLHIGEDGHVTVYTGKAEVGQNIRTSLTQVVAEELRIPTESITMVMGDTRLTPYDRGTFGSQTTPRMSPQLRRAAAAARRILIDQAAEHWSVDPEALILEEGRVRETGSGRLAEIGSLTQGRKLLTTITSEETVTAAAYWKTAGRSHSKVNGRSFITGAHRYASDMRLPGTQVGKVLRPPSFGAELLSLDASEARGIPGVTVVHDGGFVGIAAPDEATAVRALLSLRADWSEKPQPSRADLFDYLKENVRPSAEGRRRRRPHIVGSTADALDSAHNRQSNTFTIDYIAHAPLEPRAALADWSEDGTLNVWTGTQRPFGVRDELVRAFRIPEERVHVRMPDAGSGYGGKHTGEAAVEAARIAKEAKKPISLVWTREEEFTWAYFRPAGVIEISSGVDAEGSLTAWEFHNYNSGGSAIRTPYEVPNQHVEFHRTDSPLRQGSYRALASTANIFARESHMDDLAHAADEDPLAYRMRHLKNKRLRAVFHASADRFGWKNREKSGANGFGMGGGIEKGSYVAACAEVEIEQESGRVRVVRVVEAFECGAVINPGQLENQIEGCIVQGLGGALFERIEFADGKILNPAFSSYRVPRFSDLPEIEVVILDRKDLPPAGAGETPICGIAPAVGNAIFDATGVRLRSLPLIPDSNIVLSD